VLHSEPTLGLRVAAAAPFSDFTSPLPNVRWLSARLRLPVVGIAARAKRVDLQDVSWLSRHLIAVAVVGVAVASVGAVFAFARPTYHRT